jgi:hypothetical protein
MSKQGDRKKRESKKAKGESKLLNSQQDAKNQSLKANPNSDSGNDKPKQTAVVPCKRFIDRPGVTAIVGTVFLGLAGFIQFYSHSAAIWLLFFALVAYAQALRFEIKDYQILKDSKAPEVIFLAATVLALIFCSALQLFELNKPKISAVQQILQAPQVNIVSSPIEMPSAGESPLSLATIQNQMLRELEITKPNDFPVSVDFSIQFPEAIVSMKSEHALDAFPHWLPLPVDVETSGNVAPPSLSIEPFATNDLTGLWRLKMDSLPKNSSTTVDVVTAIGGGAGFFGQATTNFSPPVNSPFWFISGNFRTSGDPDKNALNICIPLKYDRQNRTVNALPTQGPLAMTNTFVFEQGPGFRVPGIITVNGYIVIFDGMSPGFYSSISLVSSGAVVDFGLSAEALPAVKITMTNGTVIHIGRSPPVFFSEASNGVFLFGSHNSQH